MAVATSIADGTCVSLPTHWFSAIPYLPEPPPPARDPDDAPESCIERLRRIRPRALTEQDHASHTWHDIPSAILDMYEEVGRPTPLVRARRLERYLETPARIYIKREDVLPVGSFKLNSAIAQAYFTRQEGASKVVTETGAGQWGVALAYASRLYGLETVVFWANVSERQKPYRSALAKMLGARIVASPSHQTEVGRRLLRRSPDEPGSLGTAIGEAVSFASEHEEYRYLSGSNLPHVLLHQSVIGLETKAQLEALGEKPDRLVACVGGGSNLGGFMFPFLPEKLESPQDLRLIAAEADSAPRLTRGQWRYESADPLGVTPLTMSYTLGRDYRLPVTHVGGLRQHSGSSLVGLLRKHGIIEPHAYSERDAFEIGRAFVQLEGFVPAPESCHALRAAVDSALEAKRAERSETIVVCLSGSGLLDLGGYIEVLGYQES